MPSKLLVVVLLLLIRKSLSTSTAMLIIHVNCGTSLITTYLLPLFLSHLYGHSTGEGKFPSAEHPHPFPWVWV